MELSFLPFPHGDFLHSSGDFFIPEGCSGLNRETSTTISTRAPSAMKQHRTNARSALWTAWDNVYRSSGYVAKRNHWEIGWSFHGWRLPRLSLLSTVFKTLVLPAIRIDLVNKLRTIFKVRHFDLVLRIDASFYFLYFCGVLFRRMDFALKFR